MRHEYRDPPSAGLCCRGNSEKIKLFEFVSETAQSSSQSFGLPSGTVKQRADLLLVERQLAGSRGQAQGLIMAGRVYNGEARVEKPGDRLDQAVKLSVRSAPHYVSRGGDKLEGALSDLELVVEGQICADIGASTGGFTDCLLQKGAARVYAIDVGHAQLADKLRRDPRVISREGINARTLLAQDFPEPIDWIVVDVSFIGLDRLVAAFANILPSGRQLLALVKPQFEVGRQEASRAKGVIRDPQLREAAIVHAKDAIAAAGFEVVGACDSIVHGPKGNIEHFVYARRR
jgi:23S rRNA (cytidine1920-2'-O)/16S rRNA (cytidine1409-2'-O)-methyltransferase